MAMLNNQRVYIYKYIYMYQVYELYEYSSIFIIDKSIESIVFSYQLCINYLETMPSIIILWISTIYIDI
jgi:hypothetical protein